MVDTVVLSLDKSQFGILPSAYDSFQPSARGILEPPFYSFGNKKVFKCVLNPSPSDTKKGVYLPRITLFKAVRTGGINIFLHIEFSAPKILYNNNFDELTDNDFDEVCMALAKKLRQMGIFVFSPIIEKAEVKAIHYGKNIVFTDYTTASSVIANISKSNITTHKEADIRAYKNNGETLHFFNNNKGLAIYDKVAELNKAKKSEKGRIEKDNYCQLSLFEDYQPRKPFEVLRIEARYNTRKTIKDILDKTGNKTDGYTFRDLFSSKIAKSVLKHEVAIVDDGLSGILRNRQSIRAFADDIIAMNPKATLSQKLKAIGMKSMFIETGSRDIRKLIGANSSQWSRLVNDMSGLRYKKSEITGMVAINKALDEFKPVRLNDYQSQIEI